LQKADFIKPGIVILMVLVFAFGVGHLLVLRFENGDVYPPYSSLRSDPLGTRVLFEGLNNLAGVNADRNYRQLSRVNFKPNTTLLYIGIPGTTFDYVPRKSSAAIDRLTAGGGRLVLTFFPEIKRPAPKSHEGDPRNGETKSEHPGGRVGGDSEGSRRSTQGESLSLRRQWGFDIDFAKREDGTQGDESYQPAVTDIPSLPSPLVWHSTMFFKGLDTAWKILYTNNDRPVIIERPFRNGTIVLVSDSFGFSNEALYSDRQSLFLSRLIGPNSTILFDESHFGIVKQQNVVALIRQYKFHWFVFIIILMALLFVWKNSVHFIPPRKTSDSIEFSDPSKDRDYVRGLISLLRRNIKPDEILGVCREEWVADNKKNESLSPTKINQINDIIKGGASALSKKRMNPVAGYNAIRNIILKDNQNE
jgi:hypothetical protein